VCSQCAKGITLGSPNAFKAVLRKQLGAPQDFGELFLCYEKFEGERVKNAEKLTKKKVKPDHFVKFLADRCEVCPHNLVSPFSAYLIETMSMLDGEMGLTLPAPLADIPVLFFEALAIVRSSRHQAKSEDTKD
jgi:hypothetical protein